MKQIKKPNASDLLNFSTIGRYLTGGDSRNVRPYQIPKCYQKDISLIYKLLNLWLSEDFRAEEKFRESFCINKNSECEKNICSVCKNFKESEEKF